MKKVMMTLVILMAATSMTMAQQREGTFTAQPKVGVNMSTLSDADKAIFDLNFGIEGEYMLTDNIGLAAGLIMSNQGAKYNADPTENIDEYTADLDYANVPITLNYYILPGLALKAGVQPGFKVKAKIKTNGASRDVDEYYKSINMAIGTDYKIYPFDLSIPVGISYEYNNIVIDARYNYGLTKVANVGDPFYNRVFQLTLGYKLPLDL